MKKIAGVILAACLVISLSGILSAQETKVVYLDSQKILTESLAGKEAIKQLKAMSEQKETDLKKRETKLKTLGDQIQAKSATMSASAKEDLQSQYEREMKDFNRAYKDAQDELRNTQMKLMNPWNKELDNIIQDYGKKNKVDLILDRSVPSIVFGSDKIDITNHILDIFNKRYKDKQGKAKN